MDGSTMCGEQMGCAPYVLRVYQARCHFCVFAMGFLGTLHV